jgi:hypothetical protein
MITAMSSTRLRGALAAIACLAIAGCHSGPPPPPPKPANPSVAYGPTRHEGVIEKKIGEPAGLNCPDDPNKQCDLNFNVTAIQQGVACAAAPAGAHQQFLRFEVDAFSESDAFTSNDTSDALRLDRWSIEGADGVSDNALVRYAECGTGEAPVIGELAPGQHAHATVVVGAPKPASVLRYSFGELVWEWDIPSGNV